MKAQAFAVVLGVLYTLIALLSWVPGVKTVAPLGAPELAIEAGFGYLFGIFPVNIVHSLVHLAVGIWGLVASRAVASAVGFSKAVAWLFGVLFVFGLIPGFNTLFGLAPLYGADIWLHLVTAGVAAYFGYATATTAPPRRVAGV